MRQTDLKRNIQLRDSELHVLFFLEQHLQYCYNIDKQIKNVEMNVMTKTNYKDQIDPELWGNIRNFPYSMSLVAVGNIYQEAAYRKTEVPEGIGQKTMEISGTQGLAVRVDVFREKKR